MQGCRVLWYFLNFLSDGRRLCLYRKAIAPGYTSLYHAVSFGRELGYADARKLGLASEEHLDRASMVLAGGLGLALAGALAFKARGTVGAG